MSQLGEAECAGCRGWITTNQSRLAVAVVNGNGRRPSNAALTQNATLHNKTSCLRKWLESNSEEGRRPDPRPLEETLDEALAKPPPPGAPRCGVCGSRANRICFHTDSDQWIKGRDRLTAQTATKKLVRTEEVVCLTYPTEHRKITYKPVDKVTDP